MAELVVEDHSEGSGASTSGDSGIDEPVLTPPEETFVEFPLDLVEARRLPIGVETWFVRAAELERVTGRAENVTVRRDERGRTRTFSAARYDF